MRVFPGSACLTIVLAAVGASQDPPLSGSIQGDWKLVEAWANGTRLPPQILGEITLHVTGDRYVLKRVTHKEETKGKLKVDGTQKPAHVDIVMERKGEEPSTGPGILKVEKGQLHLCGAPPGHERPVDFDTLRRPMITTMVFDRLAKP